jgi:hypothetical protein
MSLNLKEKHVFITGGSEGIGLGPMSLLFRAHKSSLKVRGLFYWKCPSLSKPAARSHIKVQM